MTNDDVRMAVFGSFDGLTSVVGLVLAALTTQADVLAVCAGLAVANAVSMASGEWLSDDGTVDRGRRALTMGVSTFVTSVLPVIGFLFATGVLPVVVAALVTLAIGVVIAEIRPGSRKTSYLRTFSVLLVACALAFGASLLGKALAA